MRSGKARQNSRAAGQCNPSHSCSLSESAQAAWQQLQAAGRQWAGCSGLPSAQRQQQQSSPFVGPLPAGATEGHDTLATAPPPAGTTAKNRSQSKQPNSKEVITRAGAAHSWRRAFVQTWTAKAAHWRTAQRIPLPAAMQTRRPSVAALNSVACRTNHSPSACGFSKPTTHPCLPLPHTHTSRSPLPAASPTPPPRCGEQSPCPL